MNTRPVSIAPSRLITNAIAWALLFSPTLVIADASSDEGSRISSQTEQRTPSANQAPSKKDRILLPESAFVVVDPDAPARKLTAPMRPEARTESADISVIPQTRSRTRSATDEGVQTTTLQSANTSPTAMDHRIELKRRERKPSESSENQVNEHSPLTTAAPKPVVPTPTAPASAPAPTLSKQVELAPKKTSAEKKIAPESITAIHRATRPKLRLNNETVYSVTPTTATTLNSSDEFVEAKKSLTESTDRLRLIEKDIDDIQNLLASRAQLQDHAPVVAALPYGSVNAEKVTEAQPIVPSENTTRGSKPNESLDQWGLLQLILASFMAGIVGFVLLDRSRIHK